ncbi:hypothetical protein ANN_03580 [Periplaneta americana]|uniref:Uncharacterized protein n=1 Tax=Periplaneta americana TaxID=6978 RepID=A0ABQ8TZD9_PERAM|nr:hypothetical protein ANN_03580 [Periplaneta americana]
MTPLVVKFVALQPMKGQDRPAGCWPHVHMSEAEVDNHPTRIEVSYVDSMDNLMIEEYLEKQGIRSMQYHGPKKPVPHKHKKPNQPKNQRNNEHLADVLETYDK